MNNRVRSKHGTSRYRFLVGFALNTSCALFGGTNVFSSANSRRKPSTPATGYIPQNCVVLLTKPFIAEDSSIEQF